MACDFCGVTIGSNERCPDHGKSEHARTATDREDDSGEHEVRDVPLLVAHYRDADNLGEARRMFAEEHLCPQCANVHLCRFAPDDDGESMIVVSRCQLFRRPPTAE